MCLPGTRAGRQRHAWARPRWASAVSSGPYRTPVDRDEPRLGGGWRVRRSAAADRVVRVNGWRCAATKARPCVQTVRGHRLACRGASGADRRDRRSRLRRRPSWTRTLPDRIRCRGPSYQAGAGIPPIAPTVCDARPAARRAPQAGRAELPAMSVAAYAVASAAAARRPPGRRGVRPAGRRDSSRAGMPPAWTSARAGGARPKTSFRDHPWSRPMPVAEEQRRLRRKTRVGVRARRWASEIRLRAHGPPGATAFSETAREPRPWPAGRRWAHAGRPSVAQPEPSPRAHQAQGFRQRVETPTTRPAEATRRRCTRGPVAEIPGVSPAAPSRWMNGMATSTGT